MNPAELSPSEEDFIVTLESQADELINQFLEENPPLIQQNSLISSEQQLERERLKLKETFNLREIAHHIKNAQKLLQDYHIAIETVPNKDIQDLKDSEQSLQVMLGIPDEKIQEIYHLGTELFEKKFFQEAADIFFYITQLNPFYANVWIAIGLCFQKMEKYQQAIGSFETSILLDMHQPDAYIYCIECYNAIKDKDNATAMKNMLLPIIEKHPYKREYESLLAKL